MAIEKVSLSLARAACYLRTKLEEEAKFPPFFQRKMLIKMNLQFNFKLIQSALVILFSVVSPTMYRTNEKKFLPFSKDAVIR